MIEIHIKDADYWDDVIVTQNGSKLASVERIFMKDTGLVICKSSTFIEKKNKWQMLRPNQVEKNSCYNYTGLLQLRYCTGRYEDYTRDQYRFV